MAEFLETCDWVGQCYYRFMLCATRIVNPPQASFHCFLVNTKGHEDVNIFNYSSISIFDLKFNVYNIKIGADALSDLIIQLEIKEVKQMFVFQQELLLQSQFEQICRYAVNFHQTSDGLYVPFYLYSLTLQIHFECEYSFKTSKSKDFQKFQ